MTGSKMTPEEWNKLSRQEQIDFAKESIKARDPRDDYVWDGEDEDDRPLTREEMRAGIAAAKAKRGRPRLSPHGKSSISIRLDTDILEAFRAEGDGWQSRINAVLREWVQSHPPTKPRG